MAAADTGSSRLPGGVLSPARAGADGGTLNADQAMNSRLRDLNTEALRGEFAAQGAFLHVRDFLGPEITAQLVAAVEGVGGSVNRNYLPGHKQGGSVSRHTIDTVAPFIADLYRSPALIGWLGQLSGERPQVS